jgi:hypothetical protein
MWSGVSAQVLPAYIAAPLCKDPPVWHLQQQGKGIETEAKPENGNQTET